MLNLFKMMMMNKNDVLQALNVSWKAMVAIFIVMLVIFGSVLIMNRLTKKGKK